MQIFKLTVLHLKRMISTKSVFILTLLMPMVVMCLIMFLTSGNNDDNNNKNIIYIDFVNKDSGQKGNDLIKEFKNFSNFSVYVSNEHDAEYRVQHSVTTEAIIIPKNFSKSLANGLKPNVQVLRLNSLNTDIAAENKINYFINKNLISKQISAALKSKFQTHNNIEVQLSKEVSSNRVVAFSKIVKKDKKKSIGSEIYANLCVSFMMFTVLFIVNEIIARKDDKTLRRSFTTSNSKIALIFPIVLSFLLIGWIQVLLMTLSTSLIFKISWGSSIPALFVLFTSIIFVVLGLGVLLCRFIKTVAEAQLVCQMVVQISCMVGGSYVPLEFFPDAFKKIAYFMPQSWAVKALYDVTIYNKGLVSILPNVGVLLLFAAAFFTAGVSTIKGTIES